MVNFLPNFIHNFNADENDPKGQHPGIFLGAIFRLIKIIPKDSILIFLATISMLMKIIKNVGILVFC